MDYHTVTVSVDSLGWTEYWLHNKRCDLLTVDIATSRATRPRIRITAVESKSKKGDEPLEISTTGAPFDEAIEQVTATLSALQEFLGVEGGSSVIADLKLSALFEYMASEVLAQIAPIHSGEEYKLDILDALSALSKRELNLDGDIELDGLVVVTHPDANVPTKTLTTRSGNEYGEWPIKIVRCGIPALRSMLEAEGLEIAENVLGDGSIPGAEEPSGEPGPEATTPPQPQDEDITTEVDGKGLSAAVDGAPGLSATTLDLITGLETACRLRRFPIEPIDPTLSEEGPTLISVPVALRAGEKLAPIEAATEDVARELGVSAVAVENHPTWPYHVRFLLPRFDREFPPVPIVDPPVSEDHYLPLWLGAQVDGRPYVGHVSEWPHLLIAGTTGSGKTTFMRSLLVQVDRPQVDARIVVIDGKAEYDYLDLVSDARFVESFPEVLLGHENVVPVLEWLVQEEIPHRRGQLRTYFGAHPKAPRAPRQAYVAAQAADDNFPTYPLVIFIDEFAELMLAAGSAAREFEDLVQRVVQAGRSALVHLVLATQRPDANVLRGAIKANLPSRVALTLPSHHDSMTVLNASGAQTLLGYGDLIFQSSTTNRIRLQGFMPPL